MGAEAATKDATKAGESPPEKAGSTRARGTASERREEAGAAFRNKFGQLTGPVAAALPGFRMDVKLMLKSKTTQSLYINAEGKTFATLKEIEAFLGLRMLEGDEAALEAVAADVAAGRAQADQLQYKRVHESARQAAHAKGTMPLTQLFCKPASTEASPPRTGGPPSAAEDGGARGEPPTTPPLKAAPDAEETTVTPSPVQTTAANGRKRGRPSKTPETPEGKVPSSTAPVAAALPCPKCQKPLEFSTEFSATYENDGGWTCDRPGCKHKKKVQMLTVGRWTCGGDCQADVCDVCHQTMKDSGRPAAAEAPPAATAAPKAAKAAATTRPAISKTLTTMFKAAAAADEAEEPKATDTAAANTKQEPSKDDAPIDTAAAPAPAKKARHRLPKRAAEGAASSSAAAGAADPPPASAAGSAADLAASQQSPEAPGRSAKQQKLTFEPARKRDASGEPPPPPPSVCSCGNCVKETSKFCDQCGKPLEAAQAPAPTGDTATETPAPPVKRTRKSGKQHDPLRSQAAAVEPPPAAAEPAAAAEAEPTKPAEPKYVKYSGYHLFHKRELAKLRKTHKDVKITELFRQINVKWRKMPEARKKKLKEEAAKMPGFLVKAKKKGEKGGAKGVAGGAAAPSKALSVAARLRLIRRSLHRSKKRPAGDAATATEAADGAAAEALVDVAGPCRKKAGAVVNDGCANASAEGGGGESAAADGPPDDPPRPLLEEDVPTDSPAHHKVQWSEGLKAFFFDIKRGDDGKPVRIQATVASAGGCKESAARIARLCHAESEAGADKERLLQLRADLYKRCCPAQKKPPPKEKSEVFRNLLGEVVVITQPAPGTKPPPKAFMELELSDVDALTGDDIYYYEKELKLSQRRSMAERLTRLEQMAQRSTLPLWGGSASSSSSPPSASPAPWRATADELLAELTATGGQGPGAEFGAKFLQAFLALSQEDRRNFTPGDVAMLERTARIADGSCFSVSERRARLKERLWESRTHVDPVEKNAGFWKTWLSKAPEELPPLPAETVPAPAPEPATAEAESPPPPPPPAKPTFMQLWAKAKPALAPAAAEAAGSETAGGEAATASAATSSAATSDGASAADKTEAASASAAASSAATSDGAVDSTEDASASAAANSTATSDGADAADTIEAASAAASGVAEAVTTDAATAKQSSDRAAEEATASSAVAGETQTASSAEGLRAAGESTTLDTTADATEATEEEAPAPENTAEVASLAPTATDDATNSVANATGGTEADLPATSEANQAGVETKPDAAVDAATDEAPAEQPADEEAASAEAS